MGRRLGARGLAIGGGLGGVLILVLYLLLGGDPSEISRNLPAGGPTATSDVGEPLSEKDQEMGEFVAVVLAGTEDVWGAQFEQSGREYREPYWSLLQTKYIKNETKNYVPKFIAASMIANSPQMYGFDDFEYHPPMNYEEVTLDSPLDLDIAAECAETSSEMIKELNPELRRWCTPPDIQEYALRIPGGKRCFY